MQKYRTLIILIKANYMYWMYFLKAWLLTDNNEKIKKILGMKIKNMYGACAWEHTNISMQMIG